LKQINFITGSPCSVGPGAIAPDAPPLIQPWLSIWPEFPRKDWRDKSCYLHSQESVAEVDQGSGVASPKIWRGPTNRGGQNLWS